MRKHIYRHFLFWSLLGLMQFVVAGCSSSDEKEPLKPEGGDTHTPSDKEEYFRRGQRLVHMKPVLSTI